MASLEEIGKAAAAVIRKRSLSLDQVVNKVPKGFWADVKAVCGDTRTDTAMSTYWKRNQDKLTEIVKRHLDAEGTPANVNLVTIIPPVDAPPTVPGVHNVGNATIHPLASANMAERIEDLAAAASRQGERIDSISESLEALSANVDNIVIELGARDAGQSAAELIEEHKRENQSRMEAIEKALNTLTDNVGSIIISQAKGASLPASGEHKEPPRPPKEGRRFAGAYAHVRGVLDVVLLDMLTKKSADFGNNVSKALTAILWQHFDRPALSFEIPESELEALKLKYPAQDRSK